MSWLLTSGLWAPVLLLVLYAIGIQYERGGAWRVLYPVALAAHALSITLAHSWHALYFMDYPRSGEWSFSQQLKRLVQRNDWRGKLARPIARLLNFLAPSGAHI